MPQFCSVSARISAMSSTLFEIIIIVLVFITDFEGAESYDDKIIINESLAESVSIVLDQEEEEEEEEEEVLFKGRSHTVSEASRSNYLRQKEVLHIHPLYEFIIIRRILKCVILKMPTTYTLYKAHLHL